MLLRVQCMVEGNSAEHNLELDGDMDLMTVKVLLEDEVGIPMEDQILVSKGVKLLDSEKSLSDNGFRHNDSLVVYNARQRVARHQSYESQLNQIKSDPYSLSQLKQDNPSLADAVAAGDVALFAAVVRSIETTRRIEADERSALYKRLEANPNDAEAQNEIAEIIRMEAVQENMLSAMEHHPEAFGQVHMLYINCEVNKVPVKAFVDSGAQMTIMSPACAERCGILRLVDKRWSGMAEGVGTAKIVGRVHMVDVNIGGSYLPCSISVLDSHGVDMLLGLDMLKRHQCCIDLRANCLKVGTTNSSTAFLAEAELPRNTKQTSNGDENAAHTNANTAAADDSAVQNLMAMGFSREEVVGALSACDGNADLAAGVLMGN